MEEEEEEEEPYDDDDDLLRSLSIFSNPFALNDLIFLLIFLF